MKSPDSAVTPVKKILALGFLALLVGFAPRLISAPFLFVLPTVQKLGLLRSIAILPLLCIFIVLVQSRFRSGPWRQRLIPSIYLIFVLSLGPDFLESFVSCLSILSIYVLGTVLRRGFFANAFLLGMVIALMYGPMFVYFQSSALTPGMQGLMLIFKVCVMMRLVSWIVDRRVYRRLEFGSVWHFVEFIFCPIFFVFPGQIQYFLFDYFHRQKGEIKDDESLRRTLAMGVWGIFLMLVFSLGDGLFWRQIQNFPQEAELGVKTALHLGVGFYWLVLIYFQQTAGMAFQVSLGRLIGYQLKYDMHSPLLARSPLDYLRRHSSYVRDYIVEMGLRPLALPLLRRGWSAGFVFALTAVVSYAFYIAPQTGPRSDYDRPWPVTVALVGFLALYILFSKKDHLSPIESVKSPSRWRVRDYLAWLGTLLVLSGSKSLLGILKYMSNHDWHLN